MKYRVRYSLEFEVEAVDEEDAIERASYRLLDEIAKLVERLDVEVMPVVSGE